MREIKFRAWDHDAKVMVALNDAKFVNGMMIGAKGINFDNQVIVMQFTGLKDKNGKEIYEGDIILVESLDKTVVTDEGEGPIEEYNQILPIIFVDGGFGVRANSDYMFAAQFYTLREITSEMGQEEFQIIGNIYENPELLKEAA